MANGLSDAVRVACESRETELTLALELSKLSNNAEIEYELRRALQVLATPRSVGRQRHEVHLAVSAGEDHIMELAIETDRKAT